MCMTQYVRMAKKKKKTKKIENNAGYSRSVAREPHLKKYLHRVERLPSAASRRRSLPRGQRSHRLDDFPHFSFLSLSFSRQQTEHRGNSQNVSLCSSASTTNCLPVRTTKRLGVMSSTRGRHTWHGGRPTTHRDLPTA